MKINSKKTLALYTLFGAMALTFALFAPVSVNEVAACEYDSEYGDYICDDGYAYADECDYYDDCGDYSYADDYATASYSEVYVSNENINENYNEVIIEYYDVEDDEDYEDLDGYCRANVSRAETGDVITWEAQGSGGDEWYTYDWSGTDGLNSYYPVVDKKYTKDGTKTATVEIYSAGETITRTCSVKIVDDEDDRDRDRDDDDLDAYCKASPDDGEIGDRIKWTVYPDGGDGDYDYEWDGDENLNGDDKSITKTYKNSGRKEAEVRVKSDGDSVTVRCYADIDRDEEYNPPTGGIYLSSIPATGISPTMKVSLFVTGLLMWSAFLAYLYIARKNEKMKEEEVLASLGK